MGKLCIAWYIFPSKYLYFVVYFRGCESVCSLNECVCHFLFVCDFLSHRVRTHFKSGNESFACVCVCVSIYLNVSVPVRVCVYVCHCAPVWELSKTKNPLSHCMRLPLQAIAPIFRARSLSLEAHTADRIWLTFSHYALPPS